MTKKILIMGILMIPFLLLTRMATSQNYEVAPLYEDMPKSVQTQMDLNKANGQPLYTKIIGTIELNVDGLDESKHDELRGRFATLPEVKSISINTEKIIVVVDGATPLVNIKKVFTGLITGFHLLSSTYTVSK